MYYSKGHKLLTRDSWNWISLNQGKKIDEPHRILCIIREIEQPSGDLQELITYWQELIAEYGADYDRINLEEVSIHRGCGDYDHEWYIVGERKETLEELNLRLADIKKKLMKSNLPSWPNKKTKKKKNIKIF